MKRCQKLIISLILALSFTFCTITIPILGTINEVKKAEASFVPFIVENMEWIAPLLISVSGAYFLTKNDLVAAVHDFAYNMDQTAYATLQDTIEQHKINNQFGLSISGLVALGLYDSVKAAAESVVSYYDTAYEKTIEYVISNTTQSTGETGTYKIYPYISDEVIEFGITGTLPSTSTSSTTIIGYMVNTAEHFQIRISAAGLYFGTFYLGSIPSDPFTIKFTSEITSPTSVTYRIYVNNILKTTQYGSSIFDTIRVYNRTYVNHNILANLGNISHLLKKDDGISINDQIRSIPLPLPGVSWPYSDTYSKPLPGIEQGVNLHAKDVLWMPKYDPLTGFPVLDPSTQEPVMQPVPSTWPNYTDTQYPPWVLTPDIPGIATGVGAIGGILEGLKARVGDIGSILTGIGIGITTLITDIPKWITGDPNNPQSPDLTDPFKGFKLPDLFILFLGVLIACIKLVLRFIVFLGMIILIPADGSILPTEMAYSLTQLKNWNIGIVNVSFYSLFSSLATFLFGLKLIKYVRLYVGNVHGGIPDIYDPSQFSEGDLHNQWARSGMDMTFTDYQNIHNDWSTSHNDDSISFKGYMNQTVKLKREKERQQNRQQQRLEKSYNKRYESNNSMKVSGISTNSIKVSGIKRKSPEQEISDNF